VPLNLETLGQKPLTPRPPQDPEPALPNSEDFLLPPQELPLDHSQLPQRQDTGAKQKTNHVTLQQTILPASVITVAATAIPLKETSTHLDPAAPAEALTMATVITATEPVKGTEAAEITTEGTASDKHAAAKDTIGTEPVKGTEAAEITTEGTGSDQYTAAKDTSGNTAASETDLTTVGTAPHLPSDPGAILSAASPAKDDEETNVGQDTPRHPAPPQPIQEETNLASTRNNTSEPSQEASNSVSAGNNSTEAVVNNSGNPEKTTTDGNAGLVHPLQTTPVKETNAEEETSPKSETKSGKRRRKKREGMERKLALEGETARNTPIKSDDDLGDCCGSPPSKLATLAPIFGNTPSQESKRSSKRTKMPVPAANKKKP
jgi:hypothetical protein